jgi:L-lactate dehydrogenase complex protein LldE
VLWAAVPPRIFRSFLRVRVSLFATCLVDLVYPEVGERVVALLERLGCQVSFPPGQTCCGQPARNSGHPAAGRAPAAATLAALAATEGPIVAPFGSCVHMARHGWPELFAADPERHSAAREVGERLHDLAAFVVDVLGHGEVGGRYPGPEGTPVAYHHECHALRGLGTARQPVSLLAGVEGCRVVPLPGAEACCGFGGAFALRSPALSTGMADEKLDAAVSAGARALVSTDVGCLMHLEGRARRRGLDLRVHHLVDLLEPGGAL